MDRKGFWPIKKSCLNYSQFFLGGGTGLTLGDSRNVSRLKEAESNGCVCFHNFEQLDTDILTQVSVDRDHILEQSRRNQNKHGCISYYIFSHSYSNFCMCMLCVLCFTFYCCCHVEIKFIFKSTNRSEVSNVSHVSDTSWESMHMIVCSSHTNCNFFSLWQAGYQ